MNCDSPSAQYNLYTTLNNKSKAFPEGNDPIPQDAYVMLGGITLEELRRVMSETMGNALEEFEETYEESISV